MVGMAVVIEIERGSAGRCTVVASFNGNRHVDTFVPESAFNRQKFRDAVIAKFGLPATLETNEAIENPILEFLLDETATPDDVSRIEFSPVRMTELSDDEKVQWLWEGWLARGSVTLLVGMWKAGKTTLVSHFLSATKAGASIGGNVQPQRVLVISEETAGIWNQRRKDLNIVENVHLQCRPFKGRPTFCDWTEFIGQVVSYVQEKEIDTVVLDPWQNLNPAESENDSSPQIAALSPLHQIANARPAGCAVLLLHHPRKGESSRGQSARGSGALTGFVDIIIEFGRFSGNDPNDCRRKMSGLSRYEATPTDIVIELTETGYKTLGDVAVAKAVDRVGIIRQILIENAGKRLTLEEVHRSWPDAVAMPGVRTLRESLNQGAVDCLWERSGAGTKGDPHVFQSPSFDDPFCVFDSGRPSSMGLPESNMTQVIEGNGKG
jgi:hypothetical protein